MIALIAPILLTLAQDTWTQPFPPHHVVGNVYYVGSQGLASYLITSPAGHILINSSLEVSVPLIRQSIEKLGFKYNDVKILLISHAHWDHCAGSQLIKQQTGAQYMVMDADVPEIVDGGHSNFQYGKDSKSHYQPVKPDRILHPGDQVRLGGNVLTAHLTPGHTKGCTTWTWKTQDQGRTYNVVVVGSPNVNTGYKLVNNSLYPRIADDYERTFRTLKALPCDIFLGAHGDYYDMPAKHARMKKDGPNQFLDPEGYQAYIADRERAFRAELKKQTEPR